MRVFLPQWTCRFCDAHNVSHVENILGVGDDVTYVLSPPTKTSTLDDSLVVFCIDVSGSMCVTSEVSYLNLQ